MKNSNKNIFLVFGGIAAFVGFMLLLLYGNNNLNANKGSDSDNPDLVSEKQEFGKFIGKPVPDFVLSDKDGKTYTPADLKGRDYVLFFNEGLMCYPACWNQIARFGSDERFNSGQMMAFSVIVDSPRNWQRAVEKMPELSGATVLFDEDASVSERFEVLETPSSMHYGVLPGHTYVVVDKGGIIRNVIDDPTMSNWNDRLVEMMRTYDSR